MRIKIQFIKIRRILIKLVKHSNLGLLLLNEEADSGQQFGYQEYQGPLLQHQWQLEYHVHLHENDQRPASKTNQRGLFSSKKNKAKVWV